MHCLCEKKAGVAVLVSDKSIQEQRIKNVTGVKTVTSY